jgi:hypothetical protein
MHRSTTTLYPAVVSDKLLQEIEATASIPCSVQEHGNERASNQTS